jgi:thiamine-monophosphate kinase
VKESEFQQWIYDRSAGMNRSRVPVGPGDDMCVIDIGGQRLLVTVDQVLDSVHFDLASHGPEAAGRKAMARSLSDAAAMAAAPLGAVVSVALPPGFTSREAEGIYNGLRLVADEFDCSITGGDIASWSEGTGRLQISVTIFARPGGEQQEIEPLLRSGAKAGDSLWVTGRLGGAWHSDRHLKFTPRIRESILLAANNRIRSMIDISDGLSMDLHRLCEASGCGARILAEQVPIHPDAGREGTEPLLAALGDGEDYELLFSTPEGENVDSGGLEGLEITRIGTVTGETDITIEYPDGRVELLDKLGWDHGTQ